MLSSTSEHDREVSTTQLTKSKLSETIGEATAATAQRGCGEWHQSTVKKEFAGMINPRLSMRYNGMRY